MASNATGVDYVANRVAQMLQTSSGFRSIESDVFPSLLYTHYQYIVVLGGNMTTVAEAFNAHKSLVRTARLSHPKHSP